MAPLVLIWNVILSRLTRTPKSLAIQNILTVQREQSHLSTSSCPLPTALDSLALTMWITPQLGSLTTRRAFGAYRFGLNAHAIIDTSDFKVCRGAEVSVCV
jgi:hypothetical protein